MAKLISVFGWGLIVIAAAVIICPLFASARDVGPLANALPAGVLVALGAQLLTQGRNLREAAEKRSLFFLESCAEAYDDAESLLKDGNNDRATWIAAGRALVHAKALAADVTHEVHRRVLELHRMKHRGFFNRAIRDRPAAFFFGAKDTSIPIDEAARLSTAGEERVGRTVTSTVKELSGKSLRAVWEAGAWPEGYQDPSDRDFSDEERDKLLVLFPGLSEFLDHKDRWHSASGRLFAKDPRGAP